MRIDRRRFLAGTALTTIASAGCLQADDESESGNGNGNGNGDSEPTTAIPEDPRVDEPPYEIKEQPNDRDEWNQLSLCENMSADSDLEFQMVSAPRADLLLSNVDAETDAYAVRALTSAAEVREVFELGGDDGGDGSGEEPEEPIDAIDFAENVLLVVESGYGSGSVTHHWKRAEATDRGVRLHGCHTTPYERTDDLTARHSVVRVERPENFELARVSLTVDAERRVHFNSTEDVVAVDPT
ncbi:hypothetical protein [Natrinema amylolyticum]|uniref:hypothetical protein n=1 Tax=Natrinema amylolyticum TaxID=2878679 RepID=UPI001CF9EA74|nr:hypothetical protein [Natrinema amylolyticum]